jgi:hypothetical protein
MQEQAGPLTCVRHLAQDASDRHLRRLRHPAAGRVATSAAGGAVHRLLQVPLVPGKVRRRRGQQDRVGSAAAAAAQLPFMN